MTDRAIQMAKEIDEFVKAGKQPDEILAALRAKYPDMKPPEFKRAMGIAIDEASITAEVGEEELSALNAEYKRRFGQT